jgi:hypothetical protein
MGQKFTTHFCHIFVHVPAEDVGVLEAGSHSAAPQNMKPNMFFKIKFKQTVDFILNFRYFYKCGKKLETYI